MDAIRSRLKQVELEDGSTIPIVRRSLRHPSKKDVPLPAAQEPSPAALESTKLRVAASVRIPTESQVMVQATSRQHGLKVVQPLPSLYESQLAIANGIVQVTPDALLGILVANLGRTPQYLVKNKVIGMVTPHPLAMLPTKLTSADVLGLVQSSDDAASAEVASTEEGDSSAAVDSTSGAEEHTGTSYDKLDPVKALEELDLSTRT